MKRTLLDNSYFSRQCTTTIDFSKQTKAGACRPSLKPFPLTVSGSIVKHNYWKSIHDIGCICNTEPEVTGISCPGR
jgi:hypothetical protein